MAFAISRSGRTNRSVIIYNAIKVNVKGDFDLLGQVLYNLIDNAVKFTNENGELRIALFRENDRAVCRIRNTGAGIPAEEMPHIFERFYKSDRSRGLDKTGVGLGLYIVQTVISLHRGEVVVRSVEGEYTEFEFWLPLPPVKTKNPKQNK